MLEKDKKYKFQMTKSQKPMQNRYQNVNLTEKKLQTTVKKKNNCKFKRQKVINQCNIDIKRQN